MQTIYGSLTLNPAVEEIRTVKIQPGFGNDIFCELEKLVLPQPGTDAKEGRSQPIKAKYKALSYMWGYKTPSFLPLNLWGKTNEPKTIQCNGVSLAVTSNLYAALCQLRHETEPTVLWIDAICINQKDNDEMTGQVKLMGKIYTLAEKTIVWLGQKTFVSAQGFKAARFLAGLMRRNCLPGNTSHQEALGQSLWSLQSFIDPLRCMWHVGAFILLLRNPYFTRIWIVQEIGLSVNLEIRGGDECVSLSDFTLAATVAAFSAIGSKNSLNLTNILAVRSLVRGRPQEGMEDPSWMHAEAAKKRLALGRDILSIMSLFRGCQATQKKDKIFGLLGLCRKMENAQTFGVEENYRLSDQSAYIRTAVSLLDKRRDLDLFAALSLQPDDDNTSGLPSWVPDWSDTEHIAVPISTGSGNHLATRDSKFDYDKENNPRNLYPHTLNLSGCVVDRIAELGHVCNTEKAQASAWFCFKTTFTFAGSHRLQTFINWWTQFGGKSSVSQQFLATITCGLDSKYSTIPVMELVQRFQRRSFHDLPLFLKLAWAFVPIRASGLYFEPTLERLHIITLQCLAIPAGIFLAVYVGFAMWPRLVMIKLSEWERDFYDNGIAHMEGRIMARTKKGRLALVPNGARIGDLVAVCKGARVPLVLRNASRSGSFKIVGESYVHGLMDGKGGYDENQCERLVLV